MLFALFPVIKISPAGLAKLGTGTSEDSTNLITGKRANNMAFSLQANALPYIRSYADALNHYNNAEYSKKNPAYRYLWRKYDQDKLIRYYDETGDVAIRYCYTDVVTWHKDNSVTINTEGYMNPSTHTFATCLSGYSMSRHKGYQVVWVGGVPVCFNQRITLAEDKVIRGGVPYTRITIDRKRANAVLKIWKPVLAMAKALYVMDNDCFSRSGTRTIGVVGLYDAAPLTLDKVHAKVTQVAYINDTYNSFAERLKNNVYSIENGALVATIVPVGKPW